jgi:CSLREA domain-containing protein
MGGTRKLLAVITVGAALAMPPIASAGTIPVTTTDDNNLIACTLRDAITAANNDSAVHACPAGTGFSNDIAITATGQINLATPLPEIRSAVHINGPGATLLNVHRSSAPSTPDFSVFSMSTIAGDVGISDLTISNGSSLDTTRLADASGGGIHAASVPLTLTRVNVTGNWAEANASAIGDSAIAQARGAGVAVFSGDLTLIDSSVTDNHTVATAVSDQANLAIATLYGGGVFAEGTAVVEGSTIANNEATSTATSPGTQTIDVRGGGISAGGLTMTASTVSGNTLRSTAAAANTGSFSFLLGGGVAVFNALSQITGSTVVGNSIRNLTPIAGLLAIGGGIGIDGPATLTGSTIASNEGAGGANLATRPAGTTTLQDTIVSDPIGGDNCLTAGNAVSNGFNL